MSVLLRKTTLSGPLVKEEIMSKVKTKVKCPHSEKCVDAGGVNCLSCVNNEKRSYYQPIQQPTYPVFPCISPWRWEYHQYPYWDTVITISGGASYYSPETAP